METVRTIIIGAGQAGLAVSRCLTQQGHEHLVLERGRIGERWRSERWDSFTLLSPQWHSCLPDFPHKDGDPDSFMDAPTFVRYLEAYAASFDPPVRPHSAVTSVRRDDDAERYLVEVNGGEATFEARNVLVAIGGFQRRYVPAVAPALPADIFQIHTSDYRNPEQLPPGAVLVVGSSTSGQQIAEELSWSGRKVFLSVGRHAKLPRRYRGKDIVWWLNATGTFDQTADQVPPDRRRPAAALSGVGGGHDLDLRQLAAEGVTLLGHLEHVAGPRLSFLPDLQRSLAGGDQVAIDFLQRVDEYVLANDLDLPAEQLITPSPLAGEGWGEGDPIETLDLRAEQVSSVVWCTGYHYDLDWLHLPVLDARGEPIHRRGVTPFPGLYFIGLRWLWKRRSSFINGAAEDAIHLAEHLRG